MDRVLLETTVACALPNTYSVNAVHFAVFYVTFLFREATHWTTNLPCCPLALWLRIACQHQHTWSLALYTTSPVTPGWAQGMNIVIKFRRGVVNWGPCGHCVFTGGALGIVTKMVQVFGGRMRLMCSTEIHLSWLLEWHSNCQDPEIHDEPAAPEEANGE